MKDRDKNTALHFGIMDKCEKLEKELLQIDGITEVKFDLDGFWSGIYQVISRSQNLLASSGKESSTFGNSKYVVNHAAYVAYGSIFPQLANKNGFSAEDAEKIFEALTTLFENDSSAARPTGTMNVQKVYWWTQSEKGKQHPPIKVFKTLTFKPRKEYPFFSVEETPLPDLKPLVYEI